MGFVGFFIHRPIFATVLSIFIVLVGSIVGLSLPIAQYPEIAPPTISVTATYPGANSETIAESVATPIEQQVNGVENMLYMSSSSTNDGQMNLNVTFKLGTDLDMAQVLVQNRVTLAESQLPEEVRRLGVTVNKKSPNFSVAVNLISPDERYDGLYLSNYAVLQVKDQLARLPGVGSVSIFGAGDYSMRVWLDPEKLAARNLTASDIANSIREQNVQVAAGAIGQPPTPVERDFQFTVNTQGRFRDVDEFQKIIVNTGADGEITRLRDIGRAEIGSKSYSVNAKLTGTPTATIAVFQQPGSNALATADAVRATMDQLKASFPPGLDYKIVYDTTIFVRESIHEVVKTLLEAVALVVLVVLLFLQNWRATLIPLLAVPVSIVGTFAVMGLLGFTINNLTLFGLVLAIGIVVDDAIVVVENVERHLEEGLSRIDATTKAMSEVMGPVVGVAVVLCAVFVPTAFITGITGQFFQQFALTIAVSTVISAFNSLTLSPALAAILLKPHHAPKDVLDIFFKYTLGWLFAGFNKVFNAVTNGYTAIVRQFIRFAPITWMVYAGLVALALWLFSVVPAGFIPNQDKGYVVVAIQLPDAASLSRTQAVLDRVSEKVRSVKGVAETLEFTGYAFVTGANQSNAGSIICVLDDFEHRVGNPALSSDGVISELRKVFAQETDATIMAFGAPPVDGVGSTGGFKVMLQDRTGLGLAELERATQQFVGSSRSETDVVGLFSGFSTKVPRIFVDIDRENARAMGIPLSSVFQTLQMSLGSVYVNDFVLQGRSFQVNMSADSQFRTDPESVRALKTRNAEGDMVPLGAISQVRNATGPERVLRYNLYPATDVAGSQPPGVSTGQAIATIEKLAEQNLPRGMGFEWTELTLQQILAGNTALFVFPLCVLFVFLALSAQYESWSLPLAIVMIVPMTLLCAIGGVFLNNQDNNVFTQIGLVVLVGLACKNAILIVEFAKELEEKGMETVAAAIEACRLRLRPILMTSFAFILGVVPLLLAQGAGAEMRVALGTAVFYGMLGVTFFGIFLTPVFYVSIRKLTKPTRAK